MVHIDQFDMIKETEGINLLIINGKVEVVDKDNIFTSLMGEFLVDFNNKIEIIEILEIIIKLIIKIQGGTMVQCKNTWSNKILNAITRI